MMRLSNPNASPEAVRLYDYLCETNGKRCLTGQMESHWLGSSESEMNYLLASTGRYPAIRGLDFIDNDFSGVVRRAMEWWARGGIPSICWHTGPDFSSSYKASQEEDIDWSEAFEEGSKTNRHLLEGMDRAAPYLKRLEHAGVPVLWRPFHEFDGGWFWWGRGGAEGFIKLWRMMYERYTRHWELNNLIWVLGYSGEGRGMTDWYPGDAYVDILGVDSYTPGAHGDLYRKCKEIAPEGMPLCFHECGNIPTWAQMQEEQAPWLWFMVWHTRWLTTDEFNTRDHLREVYHCPDCVTLNQLPDLMVASAPQPITWQRVETSCFTLLFDEPDKALAERWAQKVDEVYCDVQRAFSLTPSEEKFELYLCPDVASFMERTGKTRETYEPWMVGWAGYEQKRLCILSPRVVTDRPAEAMEQVLTHEIVHIVMDALRPGDECPLWLGEGVATLYAGQTYPAENRKAPRIAEWTDEAAFANNGGYDYAGAYVWYYVRKYGMERLKRAYAGEEPEGAGLYEGFEEEAVAAWLACKRAGANPAFPAEG